MNIVYFDHETSGLTPLEGAEPIELAAIMLDPDLNEISRFGPRLMRCNTPELANHKAIAVSGHTLDEIQAIGEDPEVVYIDFATWVIENSGGERVLPAGHNVQFDITFLRWAFKKYLPNLDYEKVFDYHSICTFVVSYFKKVICERTLKSDGSKLKCNLTALGKYYELEHDAHQAMGDVEVGVQLMRILKSEMLKEQPGALPTSAS